MTEKIHSCGHSSHGIIVNTTPLTLSMYFTWIDLKNMGEYSKCFRCYCKETKRG